MTADHVSALPGLEYLGNGTRHLSEILALIPACALLANFSLDEARVVAPFFDLYRCEPGGEILAQGDAGDFLLIVVSGRVRTTEREHPNASPVIAELGPGSTLGETTLIDGEPHRASCVAAERAVLAALRREELARIILEQPLLGAKILMELVTMLSAQLRLARAHLAGSGPRAPEGQA